MQTRPIVARMRHVLVPLVLLAPVPALGCDLALLLAVDVSGSVDSGEYDIQMRGIATGLRDPVVADALIRAEAQVGLMQWTGSSRQEFSVPWQQVRDFEGLSALADRIESTPRRWRNYSTAIGEAQQVAIGWFVPVGHCARRVMDISGDGESNEGVEPATMRADLRAAGITVNGLAIEGAEEDLTGYYWENVIGGEGAFVVTADGFADFADRMQRKLRREVTQQISRNDSDGLSRSNL